MSLFPLYDVYQFSFWLLYNNPGIYSVRTPLRNDLIYTLQAVPSILYHP